MKSIRVGIIGAGWIAHKMAEALTPLNNAEVIAIASRSKEKAEKFAKEFGIERAYGSYEAMVEDPDVDLVYVATPHSHHYPHARLALEHNKPVLVEKPFAANQREADELFRMAHERNIFITEATWPRYNPMSHKVKELLDSSIIGQPHILSASLCYEMLEKERIWRPELCGGALLDVGVYVLNFARMYFGTDIIRTVTNAHIADTGVDTMESISLSFADGKMANLQAGAMVQNDRHGIISGTEGYICVDDVTCPKLIEVYRNDKLVERIQRPVDMVNGYEYEVLECKRCLEQGLIESPMMPHHETLAIIKQMDDMRKEWGVKYPMDL